MATSIPDSPRQVFRMLADLEDGIAELREGYASDYEVGYAKAGSRRHDPDLRRGSDVSDPTGNAVVDLEHRRRAVAHIALRIRDAHAAIDEARAALIKPIADPRLGVARVALRMNGRRRSQRDKTMVIPSQ